MPAPTGGSSMGAMASTILVGVDGRSGGRDALTLAAQLRAPGDRLLAVGVWTTPDLLLVPAASVDAPGSCATAVQRELDRTGITAEVVTIGTTSVARGLHELAHEHGADLLVVGSCHRSPVGRVWLGDDARSAVHDAGCAVAVAPTGWASLRRPLKRIGVGWTETSEGATALTLGRRLRDHLAGRLVVAQVVVPPSAVVAWPDMLPVNVPIAVLTQELDERRERLEGLRADDAEVFAGDPVDELRRWSHHVDLLVLGSRGYGPVRRLVLGSTSDALVRHAACPVVVVPRGGAAGFAAADPDGSTAAAALTA